MLFLVVEVTPKQMLKDVTLCCLLMRQLLVFFREFQEKGRSMCKTGYYRNRQSW